MILLRYLRAFIAAAVLFWAVRDLTGHAGAASLAALVPLGLGIPNLMPFAVVALPTIAAGVAIASRFWPDFGFDSAAAVLRDNADQVRTVLSAQLRD